MLFLRGWSALAGLEFKGWPVELLVLGSASFLNLSLDDSVLPLFSFMSVNDDVDLLTALVLSFSLLDFAVFWGSVPGEVLTGSFLRGEEDAGSASLNFELL